MRILFVGNSYTYYNDLPALFEKLANTNGHAVTVDSVTCGGRMLVEYLDKPDEYTEHLHELSQSGAFDVCVLQEQSILPIVDYGKFLDGVLRLVRKLGQVSDRFILYATWGRKEGNSKLSENGWTRESMTEQLLNAYESARETAVKAYQKQITVSPVGKYFLEVNRIEPALELFNPDMTHPSYYGSCLAALTHYVAVFGHYPQNTEILELPEWISDLFVKVIQGKQE